MGIKEFENTYISEYNKIFHEVDTSGNSSLSAIADFLFKPMFEVENFKFKMIDSN